MPSLSSVQTTEALRQEIGELLGQLGENAQAIQSQMDQFLLSIEPEIDEAIVLGDMLSLNLIRDRIAGKLSTVSIGVIQKERVAILGVITAVLRTIVRISIGAI